MKPWRPFWFAYVFGGSYRWGWHPNIIAHIRRFYREGWNKRQSLGSWLRPVRNFEDIKL